MNAEFLTKKAARFRSEILETALSAGKGHIPPAFSCIDILTTLYFGDILKYKADKPNWSERDRLIFSKGHGCLALYVVLAELGFFSKEELSSFAGDDSLLAGHPDPLIPGVETVSGSLGHGLGVGAGLALAAKKDKEEHLTVVLMGDGELDEGSVWEAALFAPQHELSNLVAIVDRNNLSSTDYTEKILKLEPLKQKWEAFGWEVDVIKDGHDSHFLLEHLSKIKKRKATKPLVILANTCKGKGVSFMEDSPLWHHRMPKGEEILQARKELSCGS